MESHTLKHLTTLLQMFLPTPQGGTTGDKSRKRVKHGMIARVNLFGSKEVELGKAQYGSKD